MARLHTAAVTLISLQRRSGIIAGGAAAVGIGIGAAGGLGGGGGQGGSRRRGFGGTTAPEKSPSMSEVPVAISAYC